jgi:hypothetical protein
MNFYTLSYRNGKTDTIIADNLFHLLTEHFEGDMDVMTREVTTVKWTDRGMHFTENLETGAVDTKIVGADINPYGWRTHGGLDNSPNQRPV